MSHAVKTKQIGDTQYISTLSMYKCIGLSAHQKLKQKAKRMQLEIQDLNGFGTAISLENSIQLLLTYQQTLSEVQLYQVNQLLKQFGQMKGGKQSNTKPMVKSGSTTSDNGLTTGKMVKPKINQAQPNTKPMVKSGSTTSDNGLTTGKLVQPKVNQTQPKTKPMVKSGSTTSDNGLTTGKMVQPKVNQTQPKTKPMVKSGLTTSDNGLTTDKPKPSAVLNLKQEKEHKTMRHLTNISIFMRSEQFIFVVLITAIIIQINHMASLFYHATTHSYAWTGWIAAYAFGSVAELTALLLTIHKGSRHILQIFAGLTFWVNLLYYEVWEGFSGSVEYITTLTIKVTLSGVIAYVIYTYAHLFTLDIFEENTRKSNS